MAVALKRLQKLWNECSMYVPHSGRKRSSSGIVSCMLLLAPKTGIIIIAFGRQIIWNCSVLIAFCLFAQTTGVFVFLPFQKNSHSVCQWKQNVNVTMLHRYSTERSQIVLGLVQKSHPKRCQDPLPCHTYMNNQPRFCGTAAVRKHWTTSGRLSPGVCFPEFTSQRLTKGCSS